MTSPAMEVVTKTLGIPQATFGVVILTVTVLAAISCDAALEVSNIRH